MHAYLEKGVSHVYLTIVRVSHTVTQDISDKRQGMVFSNSIKIQFPVVVYPMGQNSWIGFGNNKSWGDIVRIQWLNMASCKMLLDKGFPALAVFLRT